MLVANFWLSMIGGILFLLLMIMYAYVYNSGRMSINPDKIEKTNKSNAEATEQAGKNEAKFVVGLYIYSNGIAIAIITGRII